MDLNKLNRRNLLKTVGKVTMGSLIASPLSGKEPATKIPVYEKNPRYRKPAGPLTAVVLGAGGRGNVYASYSKKFPEELKIIGVAEPIPFRRERFSEMYGIEKRYQWTTWEHVLEVPKFADVVIITTPDHLHYGPAMRAISLDYDILLEKAMAQTWQQCVDIYNQSKEYNKIVGICHVLRYAPYFRKMKELIDSDKLGEIISVQHLEPIEHIHMSHSFVRGNWRNSDESTPIILSKSCHDTDILRWLIGKPSKRISSFGSLKHFRKESAPAGHTARCTDGCPVEPQCPYSALKIYLKNKTWLWHLAIPDQEDTTILEALKTGPYGKCVYQTDNNVPDHQITNIEFQDNITASFSMEAFTHYGGRRTRIFGSKGDLNGDMNTLTYTDFLTGSQGIWDSSSASQLESAHGGGDYGVLHDFIQAVTQRDETLLSSNIEASMESHLMGFKAEESRLQNGKVMDLSLVEAGISGR